MADGGEQGSIFNAASDATRLAWPCDPSKYKIGMQIGEGAFAKVYRAECQEPPAGADSAHVAIKVIDLDNLTSSIEDIRREVLTMQQSQNANVLNLFCSFVNKKELWLVMRLLEKGSCLRILQEISKKGCGEGIKEEYIATILKEVLVGLKYLHEENGQIHRDLKAGNILLDEKGNVLVADFGVSGWLTTPGGTNKGKQTLQTFVGTPCWMAPEVMEQTAGYDYKADIWSFGITALELAKGFAPYARYPPMKVLLMTLQEDPASFDKYDDTDKDSEGRKFSSYFKDVIKICLQRQPTLRPSAGKLLQHPFFKKARGKESLGELLKDFPDIGADGSPDIRAKGQTGNTADSRTGSTEYQPGTTWVFDDDGSGEVKKQSARTAPIAEQNVEDFESEFNALAVTKELDQKERT